MYWLQQSRQPYLILLAAMLLTAFCAVPRARATSTTDSKERLRVTQTVLPQIEGVFRSNQRGTPPAKTDVRQIVARQTSSEQTITSTDSFVDTIGFNAHIENPYSLYAKHFDQLKAMLSAAGIRRLRVGMVFGNQHYYDQMKELAAVGVSGLYVTSPTFTQSQILTYPSLVGASFAGYEAPNEPDRQKDPDWINKYRSFQQHLYTWVKNDPQTSKFPVVGPSVTGHFSEFGDISTYIDYGNIHNYLDVYNPDTNGWGGKTPYGVYGSIRYNLNISRTITSQKPMMSTETGYGATVDGAMTGSGRPTLDYRAQLRYLPRLLFEQYRYGIVRTYVYEFLDQGGDGTFDNFGVVKTDYTPKPAYTAIKSIIGELQDPGLTFTTRPLQIELGGNTSNVQYVAMQKRNGQYVIAIWLEVASWNPHGGGTIVVPDQTVQLTTDRSFSSARLSVMDENGNFSHRKLHITKARTDFPVSDKISLVTLTP